MKTIRSRLILIALLGAASVFSLVPRQVTQRSYDRTTGQMQDTTIRRVPISLGLDLSGGTHLALEIDESKARVTDCADAIRRAERVVRSRVSEFGTTQPIIQTVGACRLIVELPGERDMARARSIVQRTAFLELRLIDSKGRFDAALQDVAAALGGKHVLLRGNLPGEYLVAEENLALVERFLAGPDARRIVPRGIDLRWGNQTIAEPGTRYRQLFALESRAVITGDKLIEAVASRDQLTGQPIVTFELTRRAGSAFADFTGHHIGDQLAVLLDGRVQGSPATIRERIGSTGRIELGGTLEEANDLALVLRAGALPAPLEIVDQRTIGPSLGSDSIRAGVRTSLLVVALVILIMIAFYRFWGLLAVAALSAYLLYSLGGLATLGFELTLPGLAGLALAIGMAVDANVLIFERIREELRAGVPLRTAVANGFRHATSAIVDSNATTALTAVILFMVGTEAVRGFGVTLLIGLAASMISAVFVTRTLFMVWLRFRPGLKTLKQRTIARVERSRLDFIRVRRWAYAMSAAVILPGLLWIGARGLTHSIEFTGGALIQIETRAPVSTTMLRSALAAGGLPAAEIKSFGSERDFAIRARLAGASDPDVNAIRDKVAQALDAGLGSGEYELMKSEAISPQVGAELQEKAAAAIGLSFATTLAYLAVRFEWRYGMAAILASAHDILATLAFMRYFDLEVSLVTVAAVLTVLGYSLNDTIVIFDRVRENVRRSREQLRDTLNASINETLGRTIMTGGTTLGAALLLAFFAGDVIRPFALVMGIGIVIGTFSSIFIASPVLLWLAPRRPAGALARNSA